MTARLTHDASVQHALDRYGVVVTLDEALEIAKLSRASFYERVERGVYPRACRRGRWATEPLVRAVVEEGRPQQEESDEDEDPFICGAAE
jgi:hypothetical protein